VKSAQGSLRITVDCPFDFCILSDLYGFSDVRLKIFILRKKKLPEQEEYQSSFPVRHIRADVYPLVLELNSLCVLQQRGIAVGGA
jgi:hypothetical protein